MFKPDKSKLVDTSGRPLTQSLFLEVCYDEKYAYYSMKEDDYEFNGKLYPSIKKIYLEMEDPVEYTFATTYFLSWSHWQRITKNVMVKKHIKEWREELEIKMKSQAVADIMQRSAEGNFQASKWLADKGWDKRLAGRPSKDEEERDDKIAEKIKDEFSADIKRLADYKG